VRIVVISSRYPGLGSRGDQGILFSHLLSLAEHHDVTLVTAQEAPSPEAAMVVDRLARVRTLSAGRLERAFSVLGAVLRGQPAQVGWMMPMRAWRLARREASEGEVALIITSRSSRGRLSVPTVLDHIDALSFNMTNRANGSERLLVRLLARFEAWRMRAWQNRLADCVVAQMGTSREVASMLPSGPLTYVLPASYAHPIHDDPPGHERDIDVIFTGDMDYPPNREAAESLVSRIVPRVVSQRPQTSTWIVGRNASRVASSDVSTASDVPDLHSYLRRAKVAIAPIAGAGSPFKTLEAAANGAALVATKWAVDCYGLPAAIADNPDGFAAEVLRLLEDEPGRRAQADAARQVARTLTSEAVGARLDEIMRAAAGVTANGSHGVPVSQTPTADERLDAALGS
jgi:polysaccharide biosynthesis protein PslH